MFFLSLALPVFLGISILYACRNDRRIPTARLYFYLALSTGLGLGLSSIFFFLWISVLKATQAGYVYFEVSLLALALLMAWHVRRRKKRGEKASPAFTGISAPHSSRMISWSFYILCTSSVTSFVLISLGNLHGRWDAWAIWNLRARFIFRGGAGWADAFTGLLDWSHPDYPLLLPGLVAKCWSFIGRETVLVPIAISFLFTFTTILLLYSSLSILRGKNRAFLAGITLVASFQFIRFGAAQCADIPLGFFILAVLVSFAVHDFQNVPDRNLVILAGAMAGISLWTKNEGILFLLAILAGRAVASLGKNGFRALIREMFPFGKGLVPVLAVWAFFKLKYAPSSDFFSAANTGPLSSRLTDWPRYIQVAKLYLGKLIRFENGLLILACLFLLLVGVEKFGKNKSRILAPLTTLLVMHGGYYFVFILTPYDVTWHINTALDRLLLQLWPAAIFSVFLAAKWNFQSKNPTGEEERT